ncbi:hypothetical protein BGW38_007772 [Lunasporangiospora selenospora]|uniref:Polysaccharide lyase 14 domain-containing protein n=1 Tax=Lunasporangiospora selenospora TaxID=979761 RepID=A0A9P6FL08_9FUNG|nr:hypothetical protein BGW38_007772 [Lunasporangiospora selenospora]
MTGIAVAAAATPLTREQIYAQAGLVQDWVAPMPSTSLVAAGVNPADNQDTGEKFIVHNWFTTFHTIQIGGTDLSFVNNPFSGLVSIAGKAVNNSSSNSSSIGSSIGSSISGNGKSGNKTNPSTSNMVLQVNYPKGSYAPSIGPVPGGAHFYAKPFGDKTPFSKILISYDVGFPNGFDWVLGGKLPGAYGGTPYDGCSGGVQSSGTNCLTMRLMWRAGGIGEAYAYVPADPSSKFCKDPQVLCNDQYGKSIGRGLIYFQPGTWTRLDILMELNEPAGMSNGTLQIYLDGELAVNQHNIPYRSTGMVGFQGLLFSSFFGGSDPSYASPMSQNVYFRNIRLSVGEPTQLYEGPGASSSSHLIGSTASWARASAVAIVIAALFLVFDLGL